MKTIIKAIFAGLFLFVLGTEYSNAQRHRFVAPSAQVYVQGPAFAVGGCYDYPIVNRRFYTPRRINYCRTPRRGVVRYYNDFNTRRYSRSCRRW